jgi:hypothetical protein
VERHESESISEEDVSKLQDHPTQWGGAGYLFGSPSQTAPRVILEFINVAL